MDDRYRFILYNGFYGLLLTFIEPLIAEMKKKKVMQMTACEVQKLEIRDRCGGSVWCLPIEPFTC